MHGATPARKSVRGVKKSVNLLFLLQYPPEHCHVVDDQTAGHHRFRPCHAAGGRHAHHRDQRAHAPSHVLREFPLSEVAAETVWQARQDIHRILHGADDRLLVVVGPCSIHDYDAAIDYATRLATLRRELASTSSS